MKSGKIFVLFIVFLGLYLFTGLAQAEPKFGGTLNIATMDTLTTIDWQGSTNATLRQVGWHIWEGLVCYGEKFDVIPQLAESYEISDDNTKYTFKLRKGVQFQHGYGEMTAADVKASLNRFFTVGARSGDFRDIDNVEVIDDYTVKITCKEPNALLLALLASPLAFPCIMPEELTKIPRGELEIKNNQVVGTGPYEIVEWTPGERYVLKKFEDYTQDDAYDGINGMGGKRTAYLDTIIFNVVSDANTRLSGLKTGQYDWAKDPPNIEYKTIMADDRFGIMDKGCMIKEAYSFNVQNPPTDKVAFRKAVVMAMNMDEIMNAGLMGVKELYRLDSSIFAIESPWWFPAGDIAGVYNRNEDEVNLAAVKELLEIANYQGEEIVLLSATREPQALVAQSQLRKAGINATVENYDSATALTRRKELDKWHLFLGGASQTFFDPNTSRLFFYGETSESRFGYNNSMVNVMVEEADSYVDIDQRIKAYESIQLFLWNDLPVFNAGDKFNWSAYSKKLKGNLGGWYLVRFWDIWKEE